MDSSTARQALLDERVKLVHQLDEIGATEDGDLRADVDMGDGFADAGAATAERTERLGLAESIKSQLDEVDAALNRIDEGTYGTCVSCGKPIPEARLEFRPASIYCVDCKSRR